MRIPMPVRARVFTCSSLVLASVMLTACASDITAPSAPTEPSPQEHAPKFVITSASKALAGVTDGTYTFSFDPRKDQRFSLGRNSLLIPARAVCEMDGSSGYGKEFWNKPCAPETSPVTISVTIRNAASSHPGIEFAPAMRFNPSKEVQLSIYAKKATRKDASHLVMIYCADNGDCIDESRTDKDLETHVDKKSGQVFRRIKHFSGYVVWGRALAGGLEE
jgi:hypothetical protein